MPCHPVIWNPSQPCPHCQHQPSTHRFFCARHITDRSNYLFTMLHTIRVMCCFPSRTAVSLLTISPGMHCRFQQKRHICRTMRLQRESRCNIAGRERTRIPTNPTNMSHRSRGCQDNIPLSPSIPRTIIPLSSTKLSDPTTRAGCRR